MWVARRGTPTCVGSRWAGGDGEVFVGFRGRSLGELRGVFGKGWLLCPCKLLQHRPGMVRNLVDAWFLQHHHCDTPLAKKISIRTVSC